MASRRAAAAAGGAKGKSSSKRRVRSSSDEEEEEPAEVRRRSRGPLPREAGAAAGAAAAAAAPAPPAHAGAVPGTAALQALLRFFTVRGRATRSQVERVFAEIKDRCTHADSKTLTLDAALQGINSQIRFMELEIKKHRSEIDDDVWWCLVDNTERVAAANAASAALAASQEDGNAAVAASSSSAKKQMDAGSLAKLHNPTLFSEREIPYFKALLDGVLESPAGVVVLSDALGLRLTAGVGTGAAARKMQLSEPEAAHALTRFEEHGWIRTLPAPLARLAGAASKLRGKARTQYIALGERVYAELKGYVERKSDGRSCSECKKPCVLGVICPQQSSESKSIADAQPARACPGRLHFACARSRFEEQGKHTCPEAECALEWDLYAKAILANNNHHHAAAAPPLRQDERKENARRAPRDDDDEHE